MELLSEQDGDVSPDVLVPSLSCHDPGEIPHDLREAQQDQ